MALAASPQRTQPVTDHVTPESAHLARVRWNGVIGEVPSDDLRQPAPLLRDLLVHAPPQLLLDLLEPCSHAVAPGTGTASAVLDLTAEH